MLKGNEKIVDENMVKSVCFKRPSKWRVAVFFEMEEEYNVSFVKLLMFS